jgi:hypothetical protein
MNNYLISMFIDNELDLDEKLEFVEIVHDDRSFKDEAVELLHQERLIRSDVAEKGILPFPVREPSAACRDHGCCRCSGADCGFSSFALSSNYRYHDFTPVCHLQT